MIMVCCVILGGLGNRPGVMLGVLLLVGFDRIAHRLLDNFLQEQFDAGRRRTYLKVSGWRLIIFGTALILMMRFRPEGLLPEVGQAELHPENEESGIRSQESGVRNQGSGDRS